MAHKSAGPVAFAALATIVNTVLPSNIHNPVRSWVNVQICQQPT